MTRRITTEQGWAVNYRRWQLSWRGGEANPTIFPTIEAAKMGTLDVEDYQRQIVPITRTVTVEIGEPLP